MNRKEVIARISVAYTALARVAEGHTEADRLLQRAYQAALEGERIHRKLGRGLNRYRLSADMTARYFVIKWFREPGKVKDALDATRLRTDCLYASALRNLLEITDATVLAPVWPLVAACSDIDYTTHIVSE